MTALDRAALILGRGGQGTKLAAQTIAWAAALDGYSPLHYSVYDGLIRGGKVASTVVIADEKPGVAVRSSFDLLVALHASWAVRYRSKIGLGGLVLFDSSVVDERELDGFDVALFGVDFTDLARQAGDARAANMVVVGLVAALWGLPKLVSLEQALEKVVPQHRRDRVAANRVVVRAGYERGVVVRNDTKLRAGR